MSITYIVSGGVYTDFTFTQIEPGTEERYGPYDTYEEAYAKWQAESRFKVDNACHKLWIGERIRFVTVLDPTPEEIEMADRLWEEEISASLLRNEEREAIRREVIQEVINEIQELGTVPTKDTKSFHRAYRIGVEDCLDVIRTMAR